MRSTREQVQTRSGARSVLLAALTLLLAACLPEDASAPRPPDRRPVQVDEALGVVRIPAASVIPIGLVLDVTGDLDTSAARTLEGAFKVAVEDYGAVQGFRVDLASALDATCTRLGGATAGEQLAAETQLVAVIGIQCAASLRGLQAPLSAAGLTLITPRPIELSFTEDPPGSAGEDRVSGVWRTAPSLAAQARAAANYAALEREQLRAVVVTDGTPATEGLAEAFRDSYESLGGTVITREALPAGEDPARVLDALAEAAPQFAFLALDAELLLVLADDWDERARLRSVTRVVTSLAAVPAFLGEPVSEGHHLVTPDLDAASASSAVTGMNASHVLERLSAAYGATPVDDWWAFAYDAMTLLLRAIDDVSLVDVDGSLVISRAELRGGIERTKFRGMTGAIACNGFGDCASDRMSIRLHDDASVTDINAIARVWTFEP